MGKDGPSAGVTIVTVLVSLFRYLSLLVLQPFHFLTIAKNTVTTLLLWQIKASPCLMSGFPNII